MASSNRHVACRMPARRSLGEGGSRVARPAFTLIEILVVTGIFVLLAGLGLFMTLDAFRATSHRSERDTIVSILEKARSRAMANIDQIKWGVCYTSPNYVIFQGGACTTGDKILANSAVANASNFAGTFPVVIFDQLTGKLVPQLSPATNELTVTVKEQGRPIDEVISINNEGRINW